MREKTKKVLVVFRNYFETEYDSLVQMTAWHFFLWCAKVCGLKGCALTSKTRNWYIRFGDWCKEGRKTKTVENAACWAVENDIIGV